MSFGQSPNYLEAETNLEELSIIVWRIIEMDEEMNLPFISKENPLIEVLLKIVKEQDEVHFFDTGECLSENSKEETIIRIENWLNSQKQNPQTKEQGIISTAPYYPLSSFRIKERWDFNPTTSTMECQIISIAPVRAVYDSEHHIIRGYEALFYLHYPSLSKYLAQELVDYPFDDTITLNWQQVFDLRLFDAKIVKEYNLTERMAERKKRAEKLKNLGLDLWSY